MIKSIYWDIDETLIHSSIEDPNQNHLQILPATMIATIRLSVRALKELSTFPAI